MLFDIIAVYTMLWISAVQVIKCHLIFCFLRSLSSKLNFWGPSKALRRSFWFSMFSTLCYWSLCCFCITICHVVKREAQSKAEGTQDALVWTEHWRFTGQFFRQCLYLLQLQSTATFIFYAQLPARIYNNSTHGPYLSHTHRSSIFIFIYFIFQELQKLSCTGYEVGL